MQKQTGSVHAVIIILLTLGLIGSVGFIFWQNFIVNGPTRGAVQSNKSTKSDVVKAEIVEVKKKTYCATFEKVCFEYPEKWTIKQVDELSGDSKDAFTIADPENTVVLAFQSGIGANDGSCCGPMPEGPVTIISSQKVPHFGEVASSQYDKDRSNGVYVSEVVTTSVKGVFPDPSEPIVNSVIKGYIPQLVLHNSLTLAKKQTVTRINGNITGDSYINGQQNGTIFLFGTVTFSIKSTPKIFSSLNEAKAQLKGTSFQQAKAILLSAHYE
ncbi:MAG: hypothetical protein H6797_02400 [Candidatus Nomurabacteria bacterium]|nr:MAG: hypothetical protein H6797_02400 [Candidatus Nomurabacteria bacterium]